MLMKAQLPQLKCLKPRFTKLSNKIIIVAIEV